PDGAFSGGRCGKRLSRASGRAGPAFSARTGGVRLGSDALRTGGVPAGLPARCRWDAHTLRRGVEGSRRARVRPITGRKGGRAPLDSRAVLLVDCGAYPLQELATRARRVGFRVLRAKTPEDAREALRDR